MPKRKAASKISGLVESDGEDVMQMGANGDASAKEEPLDERPAKKPRGRPKAAQPKVEVSKTAPEPARPSATAPAKQETLPKRHSGRGRPRTSTSEPEPQAHNAGKEEGKGEHKEEGKEEDKDVHDAPDAENAQPDVSNDDLGSSKDTTMPKKRGRGRKASTSSKQVTADGEFEYTPSSSRHSRPPEEPEDPPKRRPGRQRKPVEEEDAVVPDSQKPVPEVNETILSEEEPVNSREKSVSPLKPRVNEQTAQRPGSSRKRGPGGLSDNEKTSEPELRRKLGEMTKKYESLETKYRNLREIGIVEANANFEKLKKQCEAATAASTELIASLKKELAHHTALGQQARTLQKKLKERESEVSELQSQVDDLSSQLSTAQTEIKALQTKLAAARNAAASVESASSKGPGSAVKNSSANRNAGAEAAQAAQLAQLKEDLYSDLTGLIIRSVKKRESDNLYDCIQTGTNGTLHFKLAVSHDGDGKSSNFDSAEFHYMPLLDTNRDRDLVDLLPEYLTVDITFSRQHASKFYTRVMDTLTKKRVESGD